jgi:acyl-CoA dehydrogenase
VKADENAGAVAPKAEQSERAKNPAAARADLAAWREEKAQNFFDSDGFFQRVLKHHLGPERFAEEALGLSAFGAECAGLLNELVNETNRDEHLPVLRRFDAIGRRVEEVVFHPAYDVIGEHVYRTGVMSRYATPGQELVQLAYAYLFSQNGEGGHLCPLACTAGLIKILQRKAPEWVKARCLPGLLRTDRTHPEHFHGAQFLTELQGGSDVGANACTATPQSDGSWRINGEKWFCSVIDADLYLMTARPVGAPEGTPGLGAFVVPRKLDDGTHNGVYVRRLKYKLGTRSMASGEADFIDAVAWPVAVDSGFKAVVEIVLNTSRLYNAVCSSGSMRRVELEATTYARHRKAFGQPIEQFPLVGRSLARITRETHASVAGTFKLAALADRIDLGQARPEDERALPAGGQHEQVLDLDPRLAGHPRGHRGPGWQRRHRRFLSASAPLPRRHRLRELGGHPQRALRPGPARPAPLPAARSLLRPRRRRGGRRPCRPRARRHEPPAACRPPRRGHPARRPPRARRAHRA